MPRVRSILTVAPLLVLAGCATTPPPSVAPRPATTIDAPAAQAWDAVIDVFAERNISIRTMERASGFISTDPLAIGRDDALRYADCGRVVGMPLPADRATYNVLVRGDSSSSTAKVTVRFTQGGRANDPQLVECSTKGVWESQAEADIKRRAEASRTRTAGAAPTSP